MTKREVQKVALQLMTIFFVIYIFIQVAVTLFYSIIGFEPYGAPTNNDSVYYHKQASLIAQSGDFSHAKLAFEYIVGSIYYICGAELGPYAYKLFISIIASVNVYLIILILGVICINNGVEKKFFNKWSMIISGLLLIYPTYNFFVLNIYRDLILVLGSLLFVYTFLAIFIYKTSKRTEYLLFVLSTLLVFILRPYFGIMIVATIVIYVFSNKKYFTVKNISAISIFVLITGLVLNFTKFGLFGVNYWSALANIESVENYRQSSSRGGLSLNIDINFRNPLLFVPTYMHAFIVNHIYPLPTYFKNIASILFSPENLIITYMGLHLLKNLRSKLKEYKELKFLIIYYLLNVGLIVGFSDNIGTNIRLRMVFVICLFIMYVISKMYYRKSSVGSSKA